MNRSFLARTEIRLTQPGYRMSHVPISVPRPLLLYASFVIRTLPYCTTAHSQGKHLRRTHSPPAAEKPTSANISHYKLAPKSYNGIHFFMIYISQSHFIYSFPIPIFRDPSLNEANPIFPLKNTAGSSE